MYTVTFPRGDRMHSSTKCSVRNLTVLTALVLAAVWQVSGADRPQLIEKGGRYALQVDGKPYLILGGQIHNSSAWPSELPEVWDSMAALHANTIEAPVYWEQGIYENGVWKPTRQWNGDETDRGLCFYEKPTVVHVKMQRF